MFSGPCFGSDFEQSKCQCKDKHLKQHHEENPYNTYHRQLNKKSQKTLTQQFKSCLRYYSILFSFHRHCICTRIETGYFGSSFQPVPIFVFGTAATNISVYINPAHTSNHFKPHGRKVYLIVVKKNNKKIWYKV